MLNQSNLEMLVDYQMATNDHASAARDFRKARRQASRELLLARLRGRSADLLCYEDVRDLLRARGTRRLGVKEIPLKAIVGSVGRCSEYTRSFLPVKESDEQRWVGIRSAVRGPRELPPIEVYQIGEVYFVIDGHHRVSVARQRGLTHYEADVIEVQTRVPLAPDIQPDSLLVQAEYAGFLMRTRLDEVRPQANLGMTASGGYAALEAQIQAHGQFVALDQRREVTPEAAAGSWYDEVYLQVVQMMRDRGMLQGFPEQTEADLYLWVSEHRSALGDALGWEVEFEVAAADLVRQSSARPQGIVARASERIVEAVTPAGLQAGPMPGTWRRERTAVHQDDCLFERILVPVGGGEHDWPAVAQAAEIACRESAQLLGLHVVGSTAEQEGERIQAMQAEFARHSEVAGVSGKLTVEVGQVANTVCGRSRWADLIVMGLAHAPAPQLAARLNSEFCALVRRCSTPVLAVPGAFSPLSRPLLAYDGGPKAREALFMSTYVALRGQVPLVVVSVEEDSLDAPAALEEARMYLEDHGVEATYVQESGPVAEAILKTAEAHEQDLILMGGYEHMPVLEMLLGSVVDEVLRGSRQPVLICR